MPTSNTDPSAVERTIPALPCIVLDDTLAFYAALGFQTTYRQTAPYAYAVVERGRIALHFYGLKDFTPEQCHSMCLIVVGDLEQMHAAFVAALRTYCGKLPIKGFPRISRFRPGQKRFTLTDPNGNSLLLVLATETPESEPPREQSRLAKALATAARFRDEKGDDALAAKTLDAALARKETHDPVEWARAYAARAELAVALGDRPTAAALQKKIEQLPLSPADRERLRDELQAAEALARSLD